MRDLRENIKAAIACWCYGDAAEEHMNAKAECATLTVMEHIIPLLEENARLKAELDAAGRSIAALHYQTDHLMSLIPAP